MSEKRRITPDDLYKMIGLEDPQISPDGRWVAFVHATPNAMDKAYTRNIWLAATDGSGVRQYTRSGKDSQPRWSPDGTQLAFVSARGGKPQIYVVPVTAPGGEPRALTSHTNGANGPVWSPDGAHIAFMASINAAELDQEDTPSATAAPRDPVEARHRKERQEEDEKNRFDPRYVERLPYRVGTAFLDDRVAQLYVVPIDEALTGEAAKARRLTRVLAAVSGVEWAADGQSLFFVRSDNPESDEPWRQQQLYRVGLDGAEALIAESDNFVYQPLVSPDGRWIAYESHTRAYSDLLPRLVVRSLENDTRVEVNTQLDRSVPYYRWLGNNTLLGGISTGGEHHLYTFSPQGQSKALSTETRALQGLGVNKAGDIAFVGTTLTSPGEVYFKGAKDNDFRPITHFHDAWVESVQIQPSESLTVTLPDGTEVQGWVMLPVDHEEGKRYPLSLHVHGGPHISWGPAMLTMWHEFQVHAAAGYVVAYCNPRASEGYGENHMKALRGRWHEAMDEVMAFVDVLIERGWVNPEQMGISGGSYGGYLTSWILAHTDRFKAGVSQRGVYNLISFSGTSDLVSFAPNEFGSIPWSDDPSLLWNLSPLAHAHKIKTPILIIHAENDFRVPIEQGEQMYTYVRRSGGTAAFIRYPREGHELTRAGEPAHRIHHMQETLGWLDRYVKGS